MAPARRHGEDPRYAQLMKPLVINVVSASASTPVVHHSAMAAAGRNPTKVKELVLAVVTAVAKAAGTKEAKGVGRIVDAVAVDIRTLVGGITIRGTGDRQRITTTRAGAPWQRL